jgi:hypothetical protein
VGPRISAAQSIERFFQITFWGLLVSAFMALVSTGRMDALTTGVVGIALALRALALTGRIRIAPNSRTLSVLALSTVAVWLADYFLFSQNFFVASVHMAAILASLRLVTARSHRNFAFTGAVAFAAIVASVLLASDASPLLWMALFLLLAIAVLASAEVRRGFQRNELIVAPVEARVTRRLAMAAVGATVGVIMIAAGLFLLVPRTARAAARLFPHSARLSGFSTSIDLGRFGAIGKDRRPVMHVRSYSGPLPPGLLWRGTALTDFDGKRWTQMPVPVMEVIPRRTVMVADRNQRSRLDGNRMLYRVDVDTSDSGILFIAGVPEYINIDLPKLRRQWEDTYRALPVEGQPLHYEISAWAGDPLPYQMRDEERRRDLRLPPIDPRVWRLAQTWVGEGATPREKAERIEQHLKQEYKYSLETTNSPPKDPIADFLFKTKRGYCEYFASAMAVMARSVGVPARVATGFASGYYNSLSGQYVIRGSEAHAWVEAWIDGEGWRTFDPTPAAPPSAASVLATKLGMWLDAADSIWQQWVVSYDLTRQAELAMRVGNRVHGWSKLWDNAAAAAQKWSLPQMAGWTLAAIGFVLLMPFAVIPAWRWWKGRVRLRRIQRVGGTRQDATELYLALLDRLAAKGFARPESATPLEFARHLPEEQATRVVRFTELYNAVRFGGRTTAAGELAEMLAAFDS